MKRFSATFLKITDNNVVKTEFLARNQTSAQRKANRQVTKHVRVLSVEQIGDGQKEA